VLELGAELISSDIVAFYELIKNAFDALSPSGAEIHFEITLRRNDYVGFRRRAASDTSDINQLKADVYKALDRSAPKESFDRSLQAFEEVREARSFVKTLDEVYARENRIVVSDTGTGMSKRDLVDSFLSIGTASRKRAVDAALADDSYKGKHPPYLGEKGIGRLSAMRLGDLLKVETATKADGHLNILDIDWSEFNDLDATLDTIEIAPEQGGSKPKPSWSGTRLIIGALTADWTLKYVQNLCADHFSRLTDPFSDTKRRPRIAVFWNGTRIPIPRLDKILFDQAHAIVKGQYVIGDSAPKLNYTFKALDLGFDHPHEEEVGAFSQSDLQGLISGTSEQIPFSALHDLGEFEFEAYWFNRRRLVGIDSIGNQKKVRDLQRRWSGILLFRDGFRVLPYGDDDDDWLALDRRSLASMGYLLNKTQFVGRVAISRLGNPKLVDQTNRQGLRVCPEQQAFVDLLQDTIQRRLRGFLVGVQELHKTPSLDKIKAETDVSRLQERASSSLRKIRRLAPDSAEIVNDVQQVFAELREYFSHAQERIDKVEIEKRQMVQMAGVGLLVEVVAHELARATENALAAIEALRGQDVPDQISSLLSALRSEMISVSKRLRVLDPLSISGRQRKEKFPLDNLIKDIFDSHKRQFERHGVRLRFSMPDHRVHVHAVKGMIVQIIENLISNSIYWLDLQRQRKPEFKPEIKISLEGDPLTVSYQDNGSGVAMENREKIFQAFFSLKEKSRRRGLGLYIARECAEHHGGSLTLKEQASQETGRLHCFMLKLPKEVVA
jgi:signal transduction histidine kinase